MEPGAKDQPARIPAGPVELRPHRADDIDGVFDQCSDPTFQRWTTVPLPYTRAHAEEFVRHRVPLGWQQGDYLAFAIADAATGEYLGTVDLTLTGTGGAEVGYGLRPSARGKGAMTAAVRAVVEWAFAAQGLALGILHWRSHVGNWPSRRVAWRTGFRLEGAIRGMCVSRGRRYDGWIASLRPQDPREPAAPWYDVPVLRSPTCVLRPFRLGDANAVVEGCTDPVTQYWLGGLPTPYTKTDALGYIQSRDEEQASGRGIYWAVADPVTDQCIGSFGLMDIDRATELGEIGYWVHPDARGHGVATTATRLIVRYAAVPSEDGGLGLRRLTLRAAVSNHASQRVAEKVGFARTGVQRAAERVGNGTFEDLAGYDLLTADVRDNGSAG